jgi:hypothetical protein
MGDVTCDRTQCLTERECVLFIGTQFSLLNLHTKTLV